MSKKIRVGQGVDVHAFADVKNRENKPLRLACLTWPQEVALAGHSDGDVAAHATCDALLSAANIGDLGSVFGTSSPQWEGASGAAMLAHVKHLLDQNGWEIGNVSVQVIGQRPRMAPRLKEATQAMSLALGGADVTLSATTTDRLGTLGREEGLAAIAVTLVLQN